MSSERRIEKLDATDDELTRHLEDAELGLLLAVSHLTGDPGILEGAPRPAQGLLAGARAATTKPRSRTRRRCFEALKRWRDDGCPAPTRPTGPTSNCSPSSSKAPGSTKRCPSSSTSSAWTARTRARRSGRSRRSPRIGTSRSRSSARVRRASARRSASSKRGPVHDLREERRRRRDLARQRLPGLPGRRLESLLQLLLRPGFRVAPALLDPARAPRILPARRRRLRPARAHPLRDRGEVAVFDEASGEWTFETEREGERETVRAQVLVSGMGQLNRPRMPEIEGMDDFAGLSFHSPAGTGRRPGRQEGRRSGRALRPVSSSRSGRAGEPPDRAPAHAALAAADPRLSRRGAERSAVALPPRSPLRGVVPLLAVLEHGGRPARDRRGRPRMGGGPASVGR